MARCKNPECVNGLTPGVIATGRGEKSGIAVIGVDSQRNAISYRWGWVRCLACNRDPQKDKAITYKHVRRSDEQIQQRKELATNKAPYKPEQQTSQVGAALGGLAGIRQGSSAATPSPTVSGETSRQLEETNRRLAQLIEANTKLTTQIAAMAEQISSLLTENRELKKALDAYSAHRAFSASEGPDLNVALLKHGG